MRCAAVLSRSVEPQPTRCRHHSHDLGRRSRIRAPLAVYSTVNEGAVIFASSTSLQHLLPTVIAASEPSTVNEFLFTAGQDLNVAISAQIAKQTSPLTLLLVFGAGLVTSLSPCTLSVMPLTIGYIGGYRQDGEAVDDETGFLLIKAVSFYAGLVTSLSLLGIASSFFGRAYGQFGSGLPIGVSLVAILMGLNLLEIAPIQLPSLDVDVRQFGLGPNLQAYLAGVTFAFVASPCSTPVLLTLLAYVSSGQSPLTAALLLTIYTTGFIAPLLIAATATEALTQLLSIRQYSQWITPASGVLLISGGTYGLLSRLVPV